MAQILEKAWNSVLNFPEDRQESIAHIVLEEIQDDIDWHNRFE